VLWNYAQWDIKIPIPSAQAVLIFSTARMPIFTSTPTAAQSLCASSCWKVEALDYLSECACRLAEERAELMCSPSANWGCQLEQCHSLAGWYSELYHKLTHILSSIIRGKAKSIQNSVGAPLRYDKPFNNVGLFGSKAFAKQPPSSFGHVINFWTN
jgi:hypothetical protein